METRIQIEEYNSEWEKMFKEEAKAIKKILGKNCSIVHHIGGTSVKGVASQPVIDIMTVVKDISLIGNIDSKFRELGYTRGAELDKGEAVLYIKGNEISTHRIYIYSKNDTEDIIRHLAIKRYLEAHPNAQKEYSDLKKKLALEFICDGEGYRKEKEAYMKELEEKAMKYKDEESKLSTDMALGMCFGMAIGTALGSAMGNVALGMTMGMSIGMCLGIALGNAKNKK